MRKIRQMKATITNAKKYNELTSSKKKEGDVVKHYAEEMDYLVKHDCIKLTKLQEHILAKRQEVISTEEKSISEEVKDLLTNPDLLPILIEEVGKFVAGEEDTILTLGLNACGRLVANASKTSYNVIPNDESGVGKDYTAEQTLKVFVPKEDLEVITRITPTLLNYWHSPKFEPEWSWDGKVLLLKDVSDSILNSEVMKTFTSDQTKAIIVINQMAVELEIKGKPCVFATTAFGTPGHEQLRRFSLVPLDTSEAQTKRIKEFHAKIVQTGIRPKKDETIQDAMKSLERVSVKVPFIYSLTDAFPNEIISRTLFGTFIDLIKASAALYQFQREKDENGFIEATLEDYDNAKKALEKVTSSGIIPISKNQKKILDVINKDLDGNTELTSNHEFWTGKEIAEHITFLTEYKSIWTNLNRLAEYGFLEKGEKNIVTSRTEVEGNERTSTRSVVAFRFISKQSFTLPSKKELIERV